MTKPFEIKGRLLARNTFLNFGGMSVPLLVGIVAIPFLVRGLGIERFGVLTLMWSVAGYMSLLDLGLGRALTQLIAERLGRGRVESIPSLVWTSLVITFCLGVAGGFIIILVSPPLIHRVLRVPAPLQSESLRATYILAASIPFVLDITGLRGVLEALQRFDLSNAIRIPTGAFAFIGPLLVLPFSHSLVPVVAVLVGGRITSWIIHLVACLHVMPELRRTVALARSEVNGLIRFGAWITVSNVVAPIISYVDRFLIGSFISMAAVAYYATPFDVMTKLGVIPAAVVGVLYPAFATSFAHDKRKAAVLLERGVKYVFLAIFPIVLIVVALAHNGLALWLGETFARNSTRVVQLLAFSLFLNALAQIPFAFIQGAGRPDITAKLHLLELSLYLPIVWWLIHAKGIEGAAIANVMDVLIDTLLLFVIANRALLDGTLDLTKRGLVLGFSLVIFAVAFPLGGIMMKMLFISCILAAFGLCGWFAILSADERMLLRRHLILMRAQVKTKSKIKP